MKKNLNQTSTRNNDQPKEVFQGRTKNEIRHLHFCAELFGETFEEQLKLPTFPESYYQINKAKFDRIDNMSHEEYMEYVREQIDL